MLEYLTAGLRLGSVRRTPQRDDVRLEPLDHRILLSAVLDSSFASSGLLSSDFGFNDSGYAVAIQGDGKILAAGTIVTSSGGNDFGLVRYLTDGTLDASFGTGGLVTLDFGTATTPSNDEARAIAIDASGKILVAGFANRGVNNDFAVARFNSNGTRDTTFGNNGRAVSNFNGNDQAYAMAIQSNGRIVVAGLVGNDFGITRYNTNGSIDTGFGSGGLARLSFGAGLDSATALAIMGDGRIVVGGYSMQGSDSQFALARYNANGTLDLSFDGDGMVLTDLGANDDRANAMVLKTDGTILLAGHSGGDMAVVQYSSSGALDISFGTSGIARIDLGGASDSAKAMLLSADGKITLAGGAGGMDGSRDFALIQLNSDGSPDAAFAPGGQVTSDFAGNRDEAFAMAMQSDGRIVLVGTTSGSTSNFALARYEIVEQTNQSPTANPGGPYSVPEGSSVQLSGGDSSDPDGSIVSYEWDFDYDGINFDADASGSRATFNASSLDGPTQRTIALRVTDNEGATHVSSTTVDVSNVAPSATLSGKVKGVAGQMLSFATALSDPGIADTHKVIWNFGDGTVVEMDAASGSSAAQHAYKAVGNYTVTVTVRDDDGGTTTSTLNVTISPFLLERSSSDPSKISLWVGGGSSNDVLRFNYEKKLIHLSINGKKMGKFNVTDRIVAFGNDGNDKIVMSGSWGRGVEFHGGNGNDKLIGGSGNDTLCGGAGNDKLIGRKGNDKMYGGAGADTLNGGVGNDMLDGGAGRDHLNGGGGKNTLLWDLEDKQPKGKAASKAKSKK